jgi:hypothetical protein
MLLLSIDHTQGQNFQSLLTTRGQQDLLEVNAGAAQRSEAATFELGKSSTIAGRRVQLDSHCILSACGGVILPTAAIFYLRVASRHLSLHLH